MKILLVTSVLPWPLRRNGGGQRSALLKKALEQLGHVDVFAVGGSTLRESTPDFDAQLPAHHVVACIVRKPNPGPLPGWAIGPLKGVARTIRHYESNYELDPAINAELKRVLQQQGPYDLIVGRYLQPVIQSGADRIEGVRKLLDFDDIDWQTLESSIREKPWPGIGGRIGAKQVLARVKRRCEAALDRFDDVFITSNEDRELLSRDATVLPNIPFADNESATIEPLPPATDSKRVLFVGDLQFPPNRDGLDRFLTRVWPLVTAKVPEAVIDIVGRGLTDERATRWRAIRGTNVIGFADDLNALYRGCAFNVVPVYFGGGTKIKVLESLAFGRTVVVAPHAMRGYACLTEHDPAVAVADTDEDFADACVQLLTTPGLRESMARRGRQIVQREFSFTRFASIVAGKVPQEALR
jgi:glycosyltransferase involved in cell wall biosynthesis